MLKGVLERLFSNSIAAGEQWHAEVAEIKETVPALGCELAEILTVYEQFFQRSSVERADTHGIGYTLQPIVDFMVHSVEHLLQTEFNCSCEYGVFLQEKFDFHRKFRYN